jgi:heme exporter protein C
MNVPIIYFSVKWWNTLHQGATITMTKAPSSGKNSMLLALLLMTFAFWAYAFAVIFTRSKPHFLLKSSMQIGFNLC